MSDEQAPRPFLNMISAAFAAEGRRMPTSLMKREPARELRGLASADEMTEPSIEAPGFSESGEATSPGFMKNLMADPLTDTATAAGIIVGDASRPRIRFLPPESVKRAAAEREAADREVAAREAAAGLSSTLPVVMGALEDEATDLSPPDLSPPEHTVTLDEAALRRLHAQILWNLDLGPSDTLPDIGPEARAAAAWSGRGVSATGTWTVTDTLVVETRRAPPPPPSELDDPEPFTLTGLDLARPTGKGPAADLARKAVSIFEAAIEELHAGRLAAAHTNAMLARVYDPQCATYRRAAAWWGHLAREGRSGPRADLRPLPATRRDLDHGRAAPPRKIGRASTRVTPLALASDEAC